MLKLSLCLDPGRPWPQLLALAQRADLAGWHAVYVCDHFMPHDPTRRSPAGPMLECWMTLSALAVRTGTVALGSLVLGNTYRRPAMVADMTATLEQVSRGRVVLGIGAGWQPNEHAAYGMPLPAARDRVAALDDACAVIRSRLSRRVPLLVGGGGRGILGVAARHADVWHTWASPEELARKNATLGELIRQAGRRPAAVARACGGTVTVLSGQHEAGRDEAGQHEAGAADDCDVRGSPQGVLSRLLAFRDAGAGEFIVRDDAHVPLERALAQLDALTRTVLPRLSSSH